MPSGGPERNERLTATTAALLVVLLAAEGVTILFIRPLLTLHIFLGVVLIPPVALKLASSGYRFVRYYTGDASYRFKGPPRLFMRLLAPVLVASTAIVFTSGRPARLRAEGRDLGRDSQDELRRLARGRLGTHPRLRLASSRARVRPPGAGLRRPGGARHSRPRYRPLGRRRDGAARPLHVDRGVRAPTWRRGRRPGLRAASGRGNAGWADGREGPAAPPLRTGDGRGRLRPST
jgi:hypothetical protein